MFWEFTSCQISFATKTLSSGSKKKEALYVNETAKWMPYG